MNVLFFDIDGVLNSHAANKELIIHKDKLKLLSLVTADLFVCCSYWTQFPEKLKELQWGDFKYAVWPYGKKKIPEDSIVVDDQPELYLRNNIVVKTVSSVGITIEEVKVLNVLLRKYRLNGLP